MIDFPRMPARVGRLPRDKRGYPVPWFIAWMKDGKPCPTGMGEPDFRVIGPSRLMEAVSTSRCWICGGSMIGSPRVYVIGPMCVVNRVTSEPASHRDCATFAAEACPFLTRPREKRSYKGLPAGIVTAGIPIARNPGATCLYQTRKAKLFQAGKGFLFELGKPERIDWYAQGRKATRAEIEESIRTGYPLLFEEARKQGVDSIRELERMRDVAMQLLPAA